jgi:hypothetical protein
MYTESQRICHAIEEMTAACCMDLFAAYDVILSPGGEPGRWAATNEPLLSGVMGFVSPEVRGTCLLASEHGPIEQSCPPGGHVRDWVGELSNQLLGRLKTKLLGHSVEIGLSTPIVLQGIRLQPMPRAAIEPTIYQSAAGMVLIWVETEVATGFSLPPARVPDAGNTGDLMIF